MKLAAIQLNSSSNKSSNLLRAERWITQACMESKSDLISLPEMFNFMGGSLEEKITNAEKIDNTSETITLLTNLAREFKVIIHGGSICEEDEGKFYNTSCVIDQTGKIIAKYRKINLFNFSSPSGQYNEATLLTPGNEICIYVVNGIKFGCIICFDLRFGDIFQTFQDERVDVIILPAAFTYETGKAHWQVLCRARAIETQAFLVASAQTGNYYTENQERRCYGHSLIVDPWGKIMAELNEEEGYIVTELDFTFQQQIRKNLPLIKN